MYMNGGYSQGGGDECPLNETLVAEEFLRTHCTRIVILCHPPPQYVKLPPADIVIIIMIHMYVDSALKLMLSPKQYVQSQ